MSIIATAVRHLMAAGVTGDALCDAIAELEAAIGCAPKPRSAAAIRQERYRHNKASQSVTGDACDEQESAPLSSPPNDIYSNPPHHTPQTHKPASDPFPKPDWADEAVWRDLKKNRKTKSLTNTETAHRRFIAAVEAMADEEWPPGKLLEAIVAKGWGGAHDPRENRKPANDKQRSQYQRPTTRQTGERVAARFAAASGGNADFVPRLGAPGGHD